MEKEKAVVLVSPPLAHNSSLSHTHTLHMGSVATEPKKKKKKKRITLWSGWACTTMPGKTRVYGTLTRANGG